MTFTTTTHLNLPGTARAALDFYQSVFGGQVQTTTYGDLGMPAGLPDTGKVVFGRLSSDDGFSVMAYDVPGQTEAVASTTRRENGTTVTDSPFFLSVRGTSFDETARRWEALADGATVVEPFAASAWSAGFGMLTDRFGVTWVVDVESTDAA